MSRIPRECKRLAEVDFPIAAVSLRSAEEKKVFGSHPSMLNQWWARRPLASSRAMLLAMLLPDPCDPVCPPTFKQAARVALPRSLVEIGNSDTDLQAALLSFIGEFSDWSRSHDQSYVSAAKALVGAASPGETPLVVDPFAGGGSIPLEALRLGCDVVATDLNPVACLILKVLLEDIPREGLPLADEVQRAGSEARRVSQDALAKCYPHDSDGSRPIAYLWARTVRCESPNCGTEIPLVRSFWLSKKASRRRALRPRVVRPNNGEPKIEFDIYEPKSEVDVIPGTVARAKATCLACGSTLSPDRLRAQLRAERGGSDVILDAEDHRKGGAQLLAVVTISRESSGRTYRLPKESDYIAVGAAKRALDKVARLRTTNQLSQIPDELLPPQGTLGFRVQLYGMNQWGDLFTARQKLHLVTTIDSLSQVKNLNPAARECMAFVLGRLADKNASLVSWDSGRETIGHVFNRQIVPIVWDFVESGFPLGGDDLYSNALDILLSVISRQAAAFGRTGNVHQADATDSPLPDGMAAIWFTDPPYYDAIPYADLSDFFLVWFKRLLPGHALLRDPFDPTNPLSPKTREAVQDNSRSVEGVPKDGAYFEGVMSRAFHEGRRVLSDDGVACVVFAHKTTEGWEALLNGMVRGGWVITSSWPIATERPGRLRSQDSAALATSVHLVCRPRASEASVGDWAEVVRELPEKVRVWMQRLESEGIRGADLVFACIGPAMEVYSRYSKVVDAQDREIPLGGEPSADDPHEKGFLAKVWEVVGKLALEQILGGVKDGPTSLEEDARLTALFLWTIQSSTADPAGESLPSAGAAMEEAGDDEDQASFGGTGGYSLPHDVVRRFAQPLGIHLESWEGRIIKTEKGVVQLLPVGDRAVQLFGQENIAAASSGWENSVSRGGRQLSLFPDEIAVPAVAPAKRGAKMSKKELLTAEGGVGSEGRSRTTLDRLHTAMLLQANGATAALKTFLEEEHRRGPDLERLANALAALYPRGSEERRLVEALTLVFPR